MEARKTKRAIVRRMITALVVSGVIVVATIIGALHTMADTGGDVEYRVLGIMLLPFLISGAGITMTATTTKKLGPILVIIGCIPLIPVGILGITAAIDGLDRIRRMKAASG